MAGTRGNPRAIALGPGYLKMAPLGSTEPADLTTAWPAAWASLGYTEDGSTFGYEPSFDDVTVAEELDPLDSAATGRNAMVTFSLAEMTTVNLKRVLNGGTIVASGTGATAMTSFEPNELGQEIQVMLGFESEDGLERWIFRQGKQTGKVEPKRMKGASKAILAASFKLYKPTTGAKIFKTMISDARNAVVIP